MREGTSHIYAKRTFYVDEDSWQIMAVDNYDQRGELWRVQEGHQVQAYDPNFYLGPATRSTTCRTAVTSRWR